MYIDKYIDQVQKYWRCKHCNYGSVSNAYTTLDANQMILQKLIN